MKKASEGRPNVGRVIVKPMESENQSIVFNPSESDKVPQQGTVINIGPRKEGDAEFVSEGDVVKYGKFVGVPITFSDGEHLVMFESEIIVIV